MGRFLFFYFAKITCVSRCVESVAWKTVFVLVAVNFFSGFVSKVSRSIVVCRRLHSTNFFTDRKKRGYGSGHNFTLRKFLSYLISTCGICLFPLLLRVHLLTASLFFIWRIPRYSSCNFLEHAIFKTHKCFYMSSCLLFLFSFKLEVTLFIFLKSTKNRREKIIFRCLKDEKAF